MTIVLLTAFSYQGGIEKFNRAFLKACSEIIYEKNRQLAVRVLHDSGTPDDRYVKPEVYKNYAGKRFHFLFESFFQLFHTKVLLLGHLNLSVLGFISKCLFPQKKLIVICHGVEVFTPLRGLRKWVLDKADEILAVSHFTKEQLVKQQQLSPEKIKVFPNTIDPCFKLPAAFEKPLYLSERYHIQPGQKVLFTLTRLNSKEGYKGYDKVLRVLPSLLEKGINLKYIIAGKADEPEAARINQLLTEMNLQRHVIMTGYIADEEVTDHLLLADLFVMPSKGEGFGIVYIEAMACGLPVIAGNKDGSTEALQFGKLGTLIDPDDPEELKMAIESALVAVSNPFQLQKNVLGCFSYELFSQRLKTILN